MPSDATLDFTSELWRVPVVLFLSNEDVERALSWSDVVRVCENLLLERARGTAWFSPRQRYVLPTDSRMMILPGGLEGKSVMGTRIYSMHSRTSPDSKKFLAEDVLDAHALNVVYEMQSAEMLTITAGERINTLRVAGELAVGAKYLANGDSNTVGLFGSGRLALGSLMALKETHAIESAKVFSRNPERRKRFCTQMSEMAGFPVWPVDFPEQALTEVDIVVSATSSLEPAFDGRLLEPGTHVGTVGGEILAGGWELDEHAMERMSVLAVLNKEHAMKGGLGEDPPNRTFTRAVEEAVITWDDVVELSDIMAGRACGRRSRRDITLFDNRAMGTSDVALAYRAYQVAKEKGIGTELEWGGGLEPEWRRGT